MEPLANVRIVSEKLDGWGISWETSNDGRYRYWCFQEHESNERRAAIVMLNPGSLSGDGEKLTQDTTLRILRNVFINTGFNPYIINLFNFATSSPAELFKQWQSKDDPSFQYAALPFSTFQAVIYAYGNYAHNERYGKEIEERISFLKSFLPDDREIVLPTNKSGSPKHPISWQRQRLTDHIHNLIRESFHE